jgi:hypothetical protein
MNFDRLLSVAALGFGAYLVYKVSQGLSKIPSAPSPSAVSSSIADWFETLFPHGNTQLAPGATIVLATGVEIPASAPKGVASFTDVDGSTKIQFFYNGRTWRTTAAQPDDTNTYYAV